jgi:hypothetical protein
MIAERTTTTVVYRGQRGIYGAAVKVTVNGAPLPPRNDLFNYSPLGFEWGYHGSGPAQLALAILAHYLGDDERALTLHQRFKRDVIGELNRSTGWSINGDDIDLWLACERERLRPSGPVDRGE